MAKYLYRANVGHNKPASQPTFGQPGSWPSKLRYVAMRMVKLLLSSLLLLLLLLLMLDQEQPILRDFSPTHSLASL